jgi:hypothetical protein
MFISYILPLRSETALHGGGLTEYLRWLAAHAEVLVVDGSAPDVFARHAAQWGGFVRHLPVDAARATPMGKVGGVLTGVDHATHERIVIADDDVRYDLEGLHAVARLLDEAHVVRPQNYFHPLPWHARWDTGRTLLNRASGGDWPGTLAVRRSALRATGGYDGAVMFENLELVRTVLAAGGRERVAQDVFVLRHPPEARHFLNQRVRQAYDEWARPARLAFQLAALPALAAVARRGGWKGVAAAALGVAAVAEWGRRRDGGAEYFPASSSLLAPGWLFVERGVCSWLAVGERVLHGGVRYRGSVLRRAATPPAELRRRHAGALASTSTSIGLNEPLLESSAEHAVTPTTMSISALSSR